MQDARQQGRLSGTAFASDFDGTLCETDWDSGKSHFKPEDLKAIARYREAGGLFGVCTGRTIGSILEVTEGVLEFDFFIVNTGSQVFGLNQELVHESTLSHDIANELYLRYGMDAPGFVSQAETGFVCVGEDSMIPGVPAVPSVYDIEGKLFGVSLEYQDDREAARVACEDLSRRYADKVVCFQNLGSVDIVPLGCSKGEGVRIAREALGARCVGGVGDSFNDLPLLEAADLAYTFHKAPEVVR
ncbi:MAG: HAD-IIB family hydrolase, partial [Coriobacteriales bacterium]|nr:HAD-IIB family hydrolase [Coriobacteriales bacterium]